MFKNIANFLSKKETFHLILLPLAISLLPFSIFLLLGSLGYRDTPIEHFLLLIVIFLWTFMGLPMIIRKEVPWLITVRGWLAVTEGIFLMVGLWVVLIILLESFLHSG